MPKTKNSSKETEKWRSNNEADSGESDAIIDPEQRELMTEDDTTESEDQSSSNDVEDGKESRTKKKKAKKKMDKEISKSGDSKLSKRAGLQDKKKSQEQQEQEGQGGAKGKGGRKKVPGKGEGRSGLYSIFCSFIFAISLALAAVFILVVFKDYVPDELRPNFLNMKNPDDKFDYAKVFDNRLKVIRRQFPNQTDRFWKILKSRGLSHLRNRNPNQPLVILLGAPPSAHSVIDCIARRLAWSLDPEVDPSHFINGAKYSEGDGDEIKKILDEMLNRLFRKGVRSALVMHLELLPPPSPILFYSFCDNDNAPYKHAGMIFTVHLPAETDPSLTPVEAEGSIETYLAKVAWSKYPYESDSISALLSRIADTVALVSSESRDVVRSECST